MELCISLSSDFSLPWRSTIVKYALRQLPTCVNRIQVYSCTTWQIFSCPNTSAHTKIAEQQKWSLVKKLTTPSISPFDAYVSTVFELLIPAEPWSKDGSEDMVEMLNIVWNWRDIPGNEVMKLSCGVAVELGKTSLEALRLATCTTGGIWMCLDSYMNAVIVKSVELFAVSYYRLPRLLGILRCGQFRHSATPWSVQASGRCTIEFTQPSQWADGTGPQMTQAHLFWHGVRQATFLLKSNRAVRPMSLIDLSVSTMTLGVAALLFVN